MKARILPGCPLKKAADHTSDLHWTLDQFSRHRFPTWWFPHAEDQDMHGPKDPHFQNSPEKPRPKFFSPLPTKAFRIFTPPKKVEIRSKSMELGLVASSQGEGGGRVMAGHEDRRTAFVTP